MQCIWLPSTLSLLNLSETAYTWTFIRVIEYNNRGSEKFSIAEKGCINSGSYKADEGGELYHYRSNKNHTGSNKRQYKQFIT